jgi:hypothetical protein
MGGLGAGIGAQLPKGSTLKATTVTFSNEVCSTFTAMSSQTLFSDHICQFHTKNNTAVMCTRVENELYKMRAKREKKQKTDWLKK